MSTGTSAHFPRLWSVSLRFTYFTPWKFTIYTSPSQSFKSLHPALFSHLLLFHFAAALPLVYSFSRPRHKSVTQTLPCSFTTGFWLSFYLFVQSSFIYECYFIFCLPSLSISFRPCMIPFHLLIPIFSCVFPIQLIPDLIKFCVPHKNTHTPKNPVLFYSSFSSYLLFLESNSWCLFLPSLLLLFCKKTYTLKLEQIFWCASFQKLITLEILSGTIVLHALSCTNNSLLRYMLNHITEGSKTEVFRWLDTFPEIFKEKYDQHRKCQSPCEEIKVWKHLRMLSYTAWCWRALNKNPHEIPSKVRHNL